MPGEIPYAAPMISNERLAGREHCQPQQSYRPGFMQTENTVHSLQMESGTKTVVLALQSNWRGHFVRISVVEKDWRNSIIVPLSVLEEFRQCVESITTSGWPLRA